MIIRSKKEMMKDEETSKPCRFCTFTPEDGDRAYAYGEVMLVADVRQRHTRSGREVGLRLGWDIANGGYHLDLHPMKPDTEIGFGLTKGIKDVGCNIPIAHCPHCNRVLNNNHVIVCYPPHKREDVDRDASWHDWREYISDNAKDDTTFFIEGTDINTDEIIVFKLSDAVVAETPEELGKINKENTLFAVYDGIGHWGGNWTTTNPLNTTNNNFGRILCFDMNKRISL